LCAYRPLIVLCIIVAIVVAAAVTYAGAVIGGWIGEEIGSAGTSSEPGSKWGSLEAGVFVTVKGNWVTDPDVGYNEISRPECRCCPCLRTGTSPPTPTPHATSWATTAAAS
jgi:hypothetical protein